MILYLWHAKLADPIIKKSLVVPLAAMVVVHGIKNASLKWLMMVKSVSNHLDVGERWVIQSMVTSANNFIGAGSG